MTLWYALLLCLMATAIGVKTENDTLIFMSNIAGFGLYWLTKLILWAHADLVARIESRR